MDRYKILKGDSPGELEKQVNELLNLAVGEDRLRWAVWGELSVLSTGYVLKYHQVMARRPVYGPSDSDCIE